MTEETQLPVRKPHIYCVWHATHLLEDVQKPTSRATYVHQHYARRSKSHPYIIYKNAHNQDQITYSYAIGNDLVHYIVQMA